MCNCPIVKFQRSQTLSLHDWSKNSVTRVLTRVHSSPTRSWKSVSGEHIFQQKNEKARYLILVRMIAQGRQLDYQIQAAELIWESLKGIELDCVKSSSWLITILCVIFHPRFSAEKQSNMQNLKDMLHFFQKSKLKVCGNLQHNRIIIWKLIKLVSLSYFALRSETNLPW